MPLGAGARTPGEDSGRRGPELRGGNAPDAPIRLKVRFDAAGTGRDSGETGTTRFLACRVASQRAAEAVAEILYPPQYQRNSDFSICQARHGQLYDFAIYLVDIAFYFTSGEIG